VKFKKVDHLPEDTVFEKEANVLLQLANRAFPWGEKVEKTGIQQLDSPLQSAEEKEGATSFIRKRVEGELSWAALEVRSRLRTATLKGY